ncbi:MAG: LLM class flavin-dependent oxidoreductase [Geminicoccaceae bacterium]
MSKEIRVNAFAMNCVGHQSPGLWRHPRDRSSAYNTLAHWTGLARTLEAGLFDGLFLADVLGTYDVYGGNPDAALRNAIQVPVNDPLLLVPAMALVTEHLGFGVTSTLTYEPPLPFARRMATLDHLTGGRAGWNIVTGYLNSAARGTGRDAQPAHDDRYDLAEEYMQVVYRLWEGSWRDDAAVRDPAAGVFTDPARVRRVTYEGSHFRVDAIALTEPSPQRTPVLYQAGTSTRGRAFAGRHAECVFISGPSPAVVAPRVQGIRKAAAEAGRDPADIQVFSLMTVVPAETDAAAAAKLADYRACIAPEGVLALVSGWTGVDLSRYGLDDPIPYERNDSGRSALEALTIADPSRTWTLRDIADFAGIGGIGPIVSGSPATCADAIEAWVDATGVDGLNLAYAVLPESFEDFARLVVPELQRRGRYKAAYAPGTLREKLKGAGRRLLEPPHPAAALRYTV